MRIAFYKPGIVFCLIGFCALLFLPFLELRPNRIALPIPVDLFKSFDWPLWALFLGKATLLFVLALQGPHRMRLCLSLMGIILSLSAAGMGGQMMENEMNAYARLSLGSGFWGVLFAFSLASSDAFSKTTMAAWGRRALIITVLIFAAVLMSRPSWSAISFMKEYYNRPQEFWNEATQHLSLSFGALIPAVCIGIPLALIAQPYAWARDMAFGFVNIAQSIPSMALFGLLILPLSWVADNISFARELGIAGIGFAPAVIALFLYSLLPIVSNTILGIQGVPPSVLEAAKGTGMTKVQLLWHISLPLALPSILTGIRIALIQNLGIATIAGLIGGGGFGTFIFQGLSQTAMDLVLLGALPTVFLAFSASIIFNALLSLQKRVGH